MNPRHLVVASVIASMLSASGTGAFAQVQPPMSAPPTPMPAPPVAQPAVPDQPPAPYPGPYPPPGNPPGQLYYPYVPQSVAPWGPRFITDWQEGMPIPYGYQRQTRARRGLIVAGSIVFGVTYLYTADLASESPNYSGANESWLWIPVLGPLLQMTESDSTLGDGALALDALAQASGVAMFIAGIVYPRTILVRNDLASMTVLPMKVGMEGSGLGLVGRF
jgi:hypothetical protein